MANALYPKWKSSIMQLTANNSLTGNVKAVLIDTGAYTYSTAHQFYTDLMGVVGVRSGALANKTYVLGVFDADDLTFSAVTGTHVEAIVLFVDTGVDATSPLVFYCDTGVTGLPVTPNGGDIIVTWDSGASKIFVL